MRIKNGKKIEREMCEGDYHHRRRIECQTNQITSSVTDNLMVVDVCLGVGGQDGKKKTFQ
jgi:hypothetical protein